MRKKSHISLAGYLVRTIDVEGMEKHKKAFYFGSILPDLTPKMITSPHEFSTSYGEWKQRIHTLVWDVNQGECKESTLWRRLGVIMHYLADYFTFPHNNTYEGNLKDHCAYEGDMKYELRSYIQTEEARQIFLSEQRRPGRAASLAEVFGYIERNHRRYLERDHSVIDDCRWIVEICSRVLRDIVGILCSAGAPAASMQIRCA